MIVVLLVGLVALCAYGWGMFWLGALATRIEESAKRQREANAMAHAIVWAEARLRSAAEQSDFGMNPDQPYDVMVYVDAYAHLKWTVVEYLKKARGQR